MSGHQKIRFRRGEIAGLDTLPSSMAGPAAPRLQSRLQRTARIVAFAASGLSLVLVALIATLLAVGSVAVNSQRLTSEAARVISQALGEQVSLATGEARIRFGFSRPFSVELGDVEVTNADGVERLAARHLSFGVRLMPLLRGQVRLTGATLSGARLARLAGSGQRSPFADLAGEDGLYGGDEVVNATFAALRAALQAMDGSDTGRFVIEDIELDIASRTIRVERAEVSERAGGADLVARLSIDGRATHATASLDRGGDGGLELMATVSTAPGTAPSALGALRAEIRGMEKAGVGSGQLSANVAIEQMNLQLQHGPELIAKANASFRLDARAPRIELTRLTAGDGRTDIALSGDFGPAMGEGSPHYYFQFASGGSFIAPVDTAEPGMPVALLLSGRLDGDFRRLQAERIVVSTSQSEVLATLALDFPKTGGTGLKLAVNVAGLPTAYAKNLWPWFAAPSARAWTLKNVFGGKVRQGRLALDLPADREPGAALTAENLDGHFEIDGARIDLAGSIPPIRDALGILDLSGSDVDVSVPSGTVYTNSGRTLAANNGTFQLHDTHLQPMMGLLSLDIDGAADAVAEVANAEPISISRFLALDPAGMAGSVSGRVDAAIPIGEGARIDELEWKVDLAFTGLTVPQAFQGQKLSDADGRIVADRRVAAIDAKGKLNGIPAVFSLSEPFGKKTGRHMTAELQVDDASRDKLMPGLGSILSGPFSVALVTGEEGASDLSIDLTKARLQIPWIGWEKKAGTRASASFVMKTADGKTEISEFSASGDGFSAEGALQVDAGGLSRADFSKLVLRDGDDFAASIERRDRGGYAVRVRGKHADVRPVVSQFTLSTRDSAGGWGATSRFSLDLELDHASGANGEILHDLKLVYSGAGTTVGGMRGSAVTASGAPLTIVDSTVDKVRRLEIATGNAGEAMRFLDMYKNVRGGVAAMRLSGTVGKALSGPVELRNFELLEEQRLDTMVNSAAPGAERSLNDTVNRQVDVTRARFQHAYAVIEKGEGYLNVADGIVRGNSIGATFQGTVFDRSGNMLVTGTFMPAYGVNRLFGEIPLLGEVLGNGRDRGLIGITFRLHGKADDPQVSFNPLSAIAPGIFRKIFEFQPKPMDTGDE